MPRPEGLAALPAVCPPLFDRAMAVLGADEPMQSGARLPVLDRDGMDARLSAPAPRRPDAVRITYLIEEWAASKRVDITSFEYAPGLMGI